MKLYKNVDIKDLESIIKNGILPISETNNDNWEDNKRVENSKDVVYLFKAINELNTFTRYGVALIEVETNAKFNEMEDEDYNKGSYEEYITNKVDVKEIKNIYIPRILKDRIELSEEVTSLITFVEIEAKCYDYDYNLVDASKETLDQFSKTAKINTNEFNYFRGIDSKRIMIDLQDVKYVLN